MNEQQTTLGAVAESQQNIPVTNEQPSTTEAVETPEVATTQNVEATTEAVQQEPANVTWTSSWVEEAQSSVKSEMTTEELLSQVNSILNENKTLNDVAVEEEKTQLQKENEEALSEIVKEQTKDLQTSEASDVKADAISNTEASDALDKEIKAWLDDIKDKKTAEDMAKKVYLAFQKERSMHQFDNEQNANTIEVLKNMVKKLNEQVTTTDNDPRVTKLDDEFYTLWRLEQSFKKDKSDASRNNLKRYYVTKLATLSPNVSANKIMDMFDWLPLKQNVMGEASPASAPVVETKKPDLPPAGLPARKRGMF